MGEKTSVLLVGIGGYGGNYVHRMLHENEGLNAEIVGAVDPFMEKQFFYEPLKDAGVPLYHHLEDFYQAHRADLAVISTPIHLHSQGAVSCMRHGSHVLCEKPVCSVIDDAYDMLAAEQETGRKLAIGYQWSYSPAIQALKKDALSGMYGKLRRMKTIVLWPRDFAYYGRSSWAGCKKNQLGNWILDSVASNATAHYLHNMLYVAGSRIDESAEVERMEVETYRANAIEMFDTCCLRAWTRSGTELLYLVTHAVAEAEIRNPEFVFEFEHGTVSAKEENGNIVIRGVKDGEEICYGEPNHDSIYKLNWMIDAVRSDKPILCGVKAAMEHTRCINRIAELIPDAPVFPEESIIRTQERVWVSGLREALSQAYDDWKLPSELRLHGFLPAKVGEMGREYTHFGLL